MRTRLFNFLTVLVVWTLAFGLLYIMPLRAETPPLGLFEQALECQFEGKYESAIEEYQRVMQANPSEEIITVGLIKVARLYEIQRKFEKAIETYQQLINNYPQALAATHAQLRMAKIYQEIREKPENAIRVFQNVLDERKIDIRYTPEAMISLLNIYREKSQGAISNQFTESLLKKYQRIIESSISDEEKARAKYLKATLLFTLDRKDNTALELLLSIITDYPHSEIIPSARYMLVKFYEENGQEGLAASQREVVLQNHPDSGAAEAIQFSTLWRTFITNQQKISEPLFNKATDFVAKFPDSTGAPNAWQYYIAGYYRVKQQYDKAIESCNQIVRNFPATQEALLALKYTEQLYLDQGKEDEAEKISKKIERLFPFQTRFTRDIESTVDIKPDTLNLSNPGKWITCYIELPTGHNVSDIKVSSVKLQGVVSAEATPTAIGDYDADGIPDLMVKFDQATVIEQLGFVTDELLLAVVGDLTTGKKFGGVDAIKGIAKGEARGQRKK